MTDTQSVGLFIGTPCYGGVVTQAYMQSVIALMAGAAATGLPLTLGLLGQDALITRSRNTLVSSFLETRNSHLLFIDADIGFQPEDVVRLLSHRKGVIGAPYPLRTAHWTAAARNRLETGEGIATAALDYVGEPLGTPDDHGLMRARYAGTGFLLISRETIEMMVEQYPDLRCRHDHVSGPTHTRDVHALFDCLIEPSTRQYLSEDYAFCHRWRAIGGEVWLDTRISLTHCGMSEFTGDPTSRIWGRRG